MEYFVKRIDEPDFGCEGRPEGKPAMDKVWLEDENQHTIVIEIEDEKLYALDKSRQWRLEVRCYLSAFFVYARLKFQKPADLKTDF